MILADDLARRRTLLLSALPLSSRASAVVAVLPYDVTVVIHVIAAGARAVALADAGVRDGVEDRTLKNNIIIF